MACLAVLISCAPPQQRERTVREKHNYIILLDLSDRLIVQPNQPERDKEIIGAIYGIFEKRVKDNLYVRSREEIKVVIAPQRGSGLRSEVFEEALYVNMESIPNVHRRAQEAERRDTFIMALNELYRKAVFSDVPSEYHGADIWKYVYEDLESDLSKDSLAQNFLFILTDGYPIVGKDLNKLEQVNKSFPELTVAVIEAAPREKDMEWDHIQEIWSAWFDSMDIEQYTFIKRKAITKEIEEIKDLISAP